MGDPSAEDRKGHRTNAPKLLLGPTGECIYDENIQHCGDGHIEAQFADNTKDRALEESDKNTLRLQSDDQEQHEKTDADQRDHHLGRDRDWGLWRCCLLLFSRGGLAVRTGLGGFLACVFDRAVSTA